MYKFAFLLICFHSFLEGIIGKKGKKLLYGFSCSLLLAMFLFRSFDSTPWPDTGRYLEYYRLMQLQWKWDVWSIHEWEPGFMLLMKIVGFLFHSDRAFLVIFGIFILLPVFRSIWIYSDSPQMSLLVLMSHGHFMQMSLYRQWCAAAILTFSYKYVKERRLMPFCGMVLMASFFHRTALVFFAVYVLYQFKISNKNIVRGFAACCLVGVFGRYTVPLLARFARVEMDLGFNGGIVNFVFLCTCCFLVKYWNRSRQNDKDYRLFFTMLMTAVIMQPFAFVFSLWSRVVVYFSFSLVFLIPDTVYKIGKKNTADTVSKAAVQAAVCAVLFIRFMLFQGGTFRFMWE